MSLGNRPHEPSRGVLDRAFDALSHQSRRRILIALMDDNPRSQDEFETVEFRSAGGEPATIEIDLHHKHLPALDEAGFIDWERRPREISRGENFADIRPLLELIDDHRDELPYNWP